MKVAQLTTVEGENFYTNVIPKDSSREFRIREIKIIDMTDEEYLSIPATFESYRYWKKPAAETSGAIEGFESFNREN